MPTDIKDAIREHRWFHRIDLGNNLITPGLDDSPAKLQRIALPRDLTGRSVLDIGAWDGFFSFEAERRGARRVMAVDSYCWDGDGWGKKAGFELVRRHLQSRVEDRRLEVHELSPVSVGVFDVVLFLGVLYHLRDPLGALQRVADVTGELLVLETVVDLLHTRTPAMAFYQSTELNRDPTNWWAPNVAGLIAMLRAVGFDRVEIVSAPKPIWQRLCRRPAGHESWWRAVQRDRVALHAFKSPVVASCS